MANILKSDFQQRNPDSETTQRAETLSNQFDAKMTSLDSEISRLEDILSLDYGPFGEFYNLRDQCYSVRHNQYEYKVCFFSRAEQLEGGRSTSLGNWKGFRENYKEAAFEEGLRCYKGPARSLTLKLECAERNEIVDIEEPEMCVYKATMKTPAACTAERFEELLKSAQF